MLRISAALLALLACLPATGVSTAQAAPTPAVSAPDQSVDDYGREWRRARKMARACGANESYMAVVSFMQGMLVDQKAEQQRALGKNVEEDSSKYTLGFEDYLDVQRSACESHVKAMAPLVDAFGVGMREGKELPLYRAPAVACPKSNPC